MKFRQIEAFNALMQAGSTVRAAEIMGITQPAVSRLIAELEASVRFPLFDRVRGRLVPTPEGKLFFREVEASFRGLDRLRSAAAGIRDFGEGSLRIGCLAAGSISLVPAAIQKFRRQYPEIRITFHVKSSSDIRDGVLDGQYDIGLAADEIDNSGVDTQVFTNLTGLVAMARDHPLAFHDVIRPEHLDGVPLLGLVAEDRARQRLDVHLTEAGVEPAYVLETPNSATVCTLAEEGDAVGLVNPMVAGHFRSRPVTFRPFDPTVMFKSLLVFPANVQKSQLVRRFTSMLLSVR
ncbi:LysR family transcriptional regulator [Rhodobacterales bacterium]|nr:LysR family transcriptional regulator [Rhodobacterales bacterium]